LAQIEFSEKENYKQTIENLEQRLLFGGYPELEQYPDWGDKKITYLKLLILIC